VTVERLMLGGASRSGGLLPPMTSGAKSDGFRKMVPEGLRSRMLLLEAGDEGSMSEYNSPVVYRSPSAGMAMTMTPMRASQTRARRKSSVAVNSRAKSKGADLIAVQKSLQLFFTRLPSEKADPYGSAASSAAAGASPMRARSLESTFGWAGLEEYRFNPASSPGGAALRLEVGPSPERAAGAKSLKPLLHRHGSVTKGREQPAGLHKSNRAEFMVRVPSTTAVLSMPGPHQDVLRACRPPAPSALKRSRLYERVVRATRNIERGPSPECRSCRAGLECGQWCTSPRFASLLPSRLSLR